MLAAPGGGRVSGGQGVGVSARAVVAKESEQAGAVTGCTSAVNRLGQVSKGDGVELGPACSRGRYSTAPADVTGGDGAGAAEQVQMPPQRRGWRARAGLVGGTGRLVARVRSRARRVAMGDDSPSSSSGGGRSEVGTTSFSGCVAGS